METQFKEQGGAATMDPGVILRWLTSRVMSHVTRTSAIGASAQKRPSGSRAKAGDRHRGGLFPSG